MEIPASEIRLKQIPESESETVFEIVKMGIFPYVAAVFGWDDAFQRQRLRTDYQAEWFHWVYRVSPGQPEQQSEQQPEERVALLCFKPYEQAYHVHLLIVLPEFQEQGIGKAVMEYVHALAQRSACKRVTLSSFVINQRAVQFYQTLGYTITETETDFYSMALELPLQGELLKRTGKA